ncbi:MAG: hypothetical protein HYY04_10390 [Chloroflexi bacterium]|nr:hypothetical protein [Chloroflexota bacterium]
MGWPSGYWLDYPHLALGANYLYLTTNIFYMSNPTSSGTGIVRVSLDSLAAGGQLAYSYYSESNVSGFAPTAGAATTMYFARHRSSTLLRLYTWPESGDWTAITYTDVSHSSYRQGSPGEVACSSPDGTNMCGYDDSRLKAGWVAGGVIGFMWGAAQGSGSLGNFPYPYVHVVRIGEASKTLIDEPVIWNSAFAWAYPGLGVNGRGHLGVSLAYAGGGRYPGSSVIVRDDITASSGSPFWQSLGVRSGTHGPGTNRWGDYLSVRPASGNGNTWVGTAFTLQGACPGPYSNCANVEPRFLWFGRQRDDPFATPTPTATRTPTSTATPTPTLTRTPTRTPTGIPVTPGATQVALTSVAGVRVDLPVVPTPAGGTGAVRMAISVSPPDVIPSSMPGRQRKLRAIFVHLTTNGVANHTPLPQPARVSLDFTRADLLPGENPLAVKLYLTSNGRDWEQLTDTQVTDLAAATTGRPPARRTSASSSWQETRPGSTSRRSAARRRAGGSLRHAADATRQKKPWMYTDERR